MLKNLSLRNKFLALIAVLLTAAISAYLFLALRLFDEDKTAFIYEGQSTLAATLADQVQTRMDALSRTIRILTNTAASADQDSARTPTELETILVTDPHIINYQFFRGDKKEYSVINPNFLTTFEVDRRLIPNLYQQLPVELNLENVSYQNASDLGDLPVLRITTPIVKRGIRMTSVIHVIVSDLIGTFARSQENDSYLLSRTSEVLVHRDANQVKDKAVFGEISFVKTILASNSKAGAMQTSDRMGEALIVSYSRLSAYPMVVISQIPKWKAFIASTRLKEKSSYFALLILIVSFMASILFTKTLTSALQRLHAAATEISKGNFEVSVNVKSRDEIGALSKAFNFMAGRIIQLMKETADKARMEKELETAQLVQENFFPIDHINVDGIALAAHFRSASECGGDWWGHIQKPDGRLVILIGDATGHGVPSALITAAAHSCCVTIQQLMQTHGQDMSPAELMGTLNRTVYAAGRGSVKMTFFVAELDPFRGTLVYANASHELPIISREALAGQPTRGRDSLDTLDGEPGNILGEKDDSTYTDHEFRLNRGDVLVWYTDGLTECRNEQGDEFGEHRLIRAVLKHADQDAKQIKESLLNKAYSFNDSSELEDDITVVVVRYEGTAKPAHLSAS